MGLRLMIYDRTERGRFGLPGLSATWRLGGSLYRGLDRLDASAGASDWDEALDWLIDHRPDEPIAEIQFWGHGKWGEVKIDGAPLDAAALSPGHRHRDQLQAVRDRLEPGALWWFRTCETFGARRGQDFARAWTDFFGCRAAGHTYIIAFWQSGLHSLDAGEHPSWSDTEGLREGTAAEPARAYWSHLREPNTISCLRGAIPDGF